VIRRILHCIPNMLNGGAQRQLLLLSREQVKSGVEVHVALLHPGPNALGLESAGARLHWMGGLNHDPRLLWRLVRLIRQIQPDIVQSWLTQMDVLAAGATRLTGTPWVLSERTSGPFYRPSFKNLARAWLARDADAVVANSAGGDDYWRTRLPAEVPRFVVGNGLSLGEIQDVEPVAPEAIGLVPGYKMVLHVGRLSPEKNIPVLVGALDEAAARVPMVAYLCGDGTHEAEAQRLLARDGSAGRIRMLGYRSDVLSLMKRADVLVSLSRFEGHPNAVLEAAACGCPLVLSDIAAHREIASEESALFVSPDSVPEVAAGIVRCLTEPDEARRRAAKARANVLKLSTAEMARRYDEVYRGVQDRRATRRAA
jgi:glycosyltransferase involved in cell wall biosynthesis